MKEGITIQAWAFGLVRRVGPAVTPVSTYVAQLLLVFLVLIIFHAPAYAQQRATDLKVIAPEPAARPHAPEHRLSPKQQEELIRRHNEMQELVTEKEQRRVETRLKAQRKPRQR